MKTNVRTMGSTGTGAGLAGGSGADEGDGFGECCARSRGALSTSLSGDDQKEEVEGSETTSGV